MGGTGGLAGRGPGDMAAAGGYSGHFGGGAYDGDAEQVSMRGNLPRITQEAGAPAVSMATSNVAKYRVGQYVQNMGASGTSGHIVNIVAKAGSAGPGMLTIKAGGAAPSDGGSAAARPLPPKSGALHKRGEKMGSSWKQRYFVLMPVERVLQYYACSGGAKGADLGAVLAVGADGTVAAAAGAAGAGAKPVLKGEVLLRDVDAVRVVADRAVLAKHLFAFELVVPGRVWLLSAPSAAERDAWMRAISACVDVGARGTGLSPEDAEPSAIEATGPSTSAVANEGSASVGALAANTVRETEAGEEEDERKAPAAAPRANDAFK